jgi:hypothetical protein
MKADISLDTGLAPQGRTGVNEGSEMIVSNLEEEEDEVEGMVHVFLAYSIF